VNRVAVKIGLLLKNRRMDEADERTAPEEEDTSMAREIEI
jgi:hypothetical protein